MRALFMEGKTSLFMEGKTSLFVEDRGRKHLHREGRESGSVSSRKFSLCRAISVVGNNECHNLVMHVTIL